MAPEPKKDVITCEKPRGVGSKRRSVDIRMGEPGLWEHRSPRERGERWELKHLSTSRRRKRDRFSE